MSVEAVKRYLVEFGMDGRVRELLGRAFLGCRATVALH